MTTRGQMRRGKIVLFRMADGSVWIGRRRGPVAVRVYPSYRVGPGLPRDAEIPRPKRVQRSAPTVEPVTTGGWYRRTDGCVTLVRWRGGRLRTVITFRTSDEAEAWENYAELVHEDSLEDLENAEGRALSAAIAVTTAVRQLALENAR